MPGRERDYENKEGRVSRDRRVSPSVREENSFVAAALGDFWKVGGFCILSVDGEDSEAQYGFSTPPEGTYVLCAITSARTQLNLPKKGECSCFTVRCGLAGSDKGRGLRPAAEIDHF
ncbi:hypothetical protein NPIL_371011 [Nephila pilipes]|uniref:Uncharacterized protein n=1 Tax=Nephila pilipes TaxID=299642 RepID=A0A8X6TH13_NEPPI|nr:hypothetical protein NPIL_371011 [Nephila pilipes]